MLDVLITKKSAGAWHAEFAADPKPNGSPQYMFRQFSISDAGPSALRHAEK
jgi:hypothetical protein